MALRDLRLSLRQVAGALEMGNRENLGARLGITGPLIELAALDRAGAVDIISDGEQIRDWLNAPQGHVPTLWKIGSIPDARHRAILPEFTLHADDRKWVLAEIGTELS